jgi:hypothetical protein
MAAGLTGEVGEELRPREGGVVDFKLQPLNHRVRQIFQPSRTKNSEAI